MIPDFDADGNLPPGVHWATWREFAQRFGISPHRLKLLKGLRNALDVLKTAGCQAVYVDGSFVTAKSVPNDFDACWDVVGVNPYLLDPILLILTDGRAAQKAKYFGELFPAQLPNGMTGLRFLEFFQIDKETGKLKGIIAIDLRGL